MLRETPALRWRYAERVGVAGAASTGAPGRRFAALRSRNFRALWLGLIVSNVGSQMQIAGQGWLVRDLHSEPLYLGLVSLASALPMILLTPFGGAIADRLPRRRLLTFTQLGMLLQAVVLAGLTLAGVIQLWEILVLAGLNAALLAFDNPGRQALLPDLVPPESLMGAVSLYSVTWTGSLLFGPALAGLLLAPLGAGGLFLLNAVSFLSVIHALATMTGVNDRVPPPRGSVIQGVVEGLRYARLNRLTGTLLVAMALVGLLGRSYVALMPIFARDVLNVGPQGYGLLLAAPGGGAILGGVGLAAMRSIRRRDLVALGGLFGFAVVLFAFSVAASLALALLWLLLAGITATLFQASTTAILQLHAPRQLRGRVMSLAAVANIGMSQLGGLSSAAVATVVGAPAAVAGGAVALLLVGLALALGAGWRRDATLASTS